MVFLIFILGVGVSPHEKTVSGSATGGLLFDKYKSSSGF